MIRTIIRGGFQAMTTDPIRKPFGLEALHDIHVHGSGGSTVVLGHGFGGNQSVWRHLTGRLAAHHRVVLYDMMGCNARNAPFFDALKYRHLDGYANDLIAIVEHAGGAPVVHVGHSVSGMVGLLAAIRRPELFALLILINSSPHYVNRDGYEGGFSQRDLQAMLDRVMENFGDWVHSFAPMAVAQAPDEPVVVEFCDGIRAMRPDIALSMLLTIFNSDLRDRLGLAKTPAVLIQSRSDPVVPSSIAAYMCARIPDCMVEFVEVPGHLPHLTHPDLIGAIIERHLDRTGRS